MKAEKGFSMLYAAYCSLDNAFGGLSIAATFSTASSSIAITTSVAALTLAAKSDMALTKHQLPSIQEAEVRESYHPALSV